LVGFNLTLFSCFSYIFLFLALFILLMYSLIGRFHVEEFSFTFASGIWLSVNLLEKFVTYGPNFG
jgi:hypothetical protein